MAYTLQTSQQPFKGGKNILASEHLQFLEAGGTLDAAAIGDTKLEVGTLLVRNTTSGKFEVYSESTQGTFEPGYDEPVVLNIDVDVNGTDDVIVGEIIVRGSVYEAKLPEAPTDAFKSKNDNIRYVKHI